MMLPQLLLALVGATLTSAAPKPNPEPAGPIPHFLTPRTSTVDWNVPRNITSTFLRKRHVGRTPEQWNARRDASPSSQDVSQGELNFRAFVAEKRAQSGRWEDMKGNVKGYPSATSWGGYNMGVFYWDKENKCKYKTWGDQKYQWGDWQDLGGYLDSSPAVCSYKNDYM
jgi:hypothetical protein